MEHYFQRTQQNFLITKFCHYFPSNQYQITSFLGNDKEFFSIKPYQKQPKINECTARAMFWILYMFKHIKGKESFYKIRSKCGKLQA